MDNSKHIFNDPLLLDQATTHKSWLNENPDSSIGSDYQRLEFLGDAILKAIHAKHLYDQYPEWDEARLTKTRSNLENNKLLAKLCKKLGLDEQIRVGGSIRKETKAWKKICADVFEAYLGAIWQDCNYNFEYIYNLYKSWTDDDPVVVDNEIVSYKNALQEFVQTKCNGKPIYEVISQEGPSHKPIFKVKCTIPLDIEVNYVICEGQSKKAAEVGAAKMMLELLKSQ
jgi:ribonuclease-3